MRKEKNENLKILGIDPGYERVGIAVIEKQKRGKEILLYSDCFKTDKKLPHGERLVLIAQELKKIIKKYKPDLLGIEKLYFNENQKTAMPVAEARGVIILIAVEGGLQVMEHTPLEIKVAVAGYGRADKKQVIDMVKRLIEIKKTIKLDDEFDAIAVALTTGACYRP
jgi:crossover junction endodeoxyribonuclease RuvC